MFKVSNFTFFKDLIFCLDQLHVNYNHISQTTIIMYHTKILKTLRFLFAYYYLKVHDLHSSAFFTLSSNNYIF